MTALHGARRWDGRVQRRAALVRRRGAQSRERRRARQQPFYMMAAARSSASYCDDLNEMFVLDGDGQVWSLGVDGLAVRCTWHLVRHLMLITNYSNHDYLGRIISIHWTPKAIQGRTMQQQHSIEIASFAT